MKEWFWDKFNSCYPAKHDVYPHCIFMIYDTNFIRTKKLATILNKDVEYPTEVNGDCLFQQDYTKNYLWVNTDMWLFIRENYYKPD